MSTPSDVTRLLQQFGERAGAAEELLPLIYDQLQVIARGRIRGERADHTLQATALVHEAYVRLLGDAHTSWRDRGHFFGVAAEAMRRVLIDHARHRGRRKRGGDRRAVPLSAVDLAADHDPDDVVALDEALTALERQDARAAGIVKLRFFAGLSVADTANALGMSERTVAREWTYARARLFQLLTGGDDDAPPG